MNYLDYNIIESIHCTVPEEQVTRRSWRERLLSWPWRPWITERRVVVQVPSPNVYLIDQIIVCHPVMAMLLRERLPVP